MFTNGEDNCINILKDAIVKNNNNLHSTIILTPVKAKLHQNLKIAIER